MFLSLAEQTGGERQDACRRKVETFKRDSGGVQRELGLPPAGGSVRLGVVADDIGRCVRGSQKKPGGAKNLLSAGRCLCEGLRCPGRAPILTSPLTEVAAPASVPGSLGRLPWQRALV